MNEAKTQTWYCVGSWRSDIIAREVTRSTDKSVWYLADTFQGQKERRAARVSSYEQYFETFEDAKSYAVERARIRLEKARRDIDTARNKLRDAEALKDTHHE